MTTQQDFLIRKIDTDVVRRLQKHARRNGRSLQQEIQRVLRRAVTSDATTLIAGAARLRKAADSMPLDEIVQSIREDRER